MAIYKDDEAMTKEQEVKFDKLIEMGWRDVAGAYLDWCREQNYTDEFRLKSLRNDFEGVGMEFDFDEEE